MIHGFESICSTNSEFSFFFGKKLKMIEGGLFDENFFMSEKDIVLLKLFHKIFIDDSLTFSFEVFLGFEFVYVLMKTINVVV